MEWNEIKRKVIRERGRKCFCGCGAAGEDAHHCLVPDLSRFRPWVTDERNMAIVNHDEHVAEKKFDNPEWRNKFWKMNCDYYGTEAMLEWVASAPPKLHSTRQT